MRTGIQYEREYRSRVWSNDHEKIFYVVEINYLNGTVLCSETEVDDIENMSNHEFHLLPLKSCDVNQFLGIYDSNGKRIYENDIVKVKWHEDEDLIEYLWIALTDDVQLSISSQEAPDSNEIESTDYTLFDLDENAYTYETLGSANGISEE